MSRRNPETTVTTGEGLPSARLFLLRSTLEHLFALISGPAEYHRLFRQRVEEGYMDHPGALEFFARQAQLSSPGCNWWLPYLIIQRNDAHLIGMCGCKGPPTGEGVVEIGYSIAPAYRGQGLATEAALALTAYALSIPDIKVVRAHTLPAISASTRVLAKCRFIRVADFNDPEDGMVWRWELHRPAANATA